MGDGNSVLKILLVLVAIIGGGYVARHAFSHGMHMVVAAQPGPAKMEAKASPRCGAASSIQNFNTRIRCNAGWRCARPAMKTRWCFTPSR
jgi:hypothetical protein